jgi:hypothetical protein
MSRKLITVLLSHHHDVLDLIDNITQAYHNILWMSNLVNQINKPMSGIETESAFSMLVFQHVGVHCTRCLHPEDGNCNAHPNAVKFSTNDWAKPRKPKLYA